MKTYHADEIEATICLTCRRFLEKDEKCSGSHETYQSSLTDVLNKLQMLNVMFLEGVISRIDDIDKRIG